MKIFPVHDRKIATMKHQPSPVRYGRRMGRAVGSRVRRYLRWRHSWKLTAAGTVTLFCAFLLAFHMHQGNAMTTALVPNSDVTVNGWAPTPAGSSYATVDEGAADNTSDYIQTSTTNGSETVEFGLSTASSVASASQLVVYINAQASVVGQSLVDTLSVNLRVNGTLQTAGTCTPGNMTWAACTVTFSGNWTQADVDSMQVQIVRNIQGSKGSTSSRADTTQVANVYGTLTYTPAVQFTQSAYRWFANKDADPANATYGGMSAKTDYTVAGSYHQDIAMGDFNGDGKLDIVTSDYSPNVISILLGNGDGTFQPKVDYTAGNYPGKVTIGDFNGDGKLDIVTQNYTDSTISVFIGNGDGTFQAKRDYTTAATNPESIASGDFNSDGKLDIVVGNVTDNFVSLGNGDGTFTAGSSYAVTGNNHGNTVGDFNGDGKLDIVTANFNANTVSVFLGNGDGTFQPKVDYTVGSYSEVVTVGDFNGDGTEDLAAANYSDNTVSVLLGNGDGTFQPKVDYAAGTYTVSITAGDFNGDSKLDLATANSGANTASVLLGNGDGTFQPKVDYTAAPNLASGIAAGDFNSDNMTDLTTVSDTPGIVSVLLAQPNTPIGLDTPLAPQDTAITAPAEGTIFRLRLDLHVSVGQADPSSTSFKLQFANKGAAASCGVATGYTDVTGASTIRYGDNSVATNGARLITNANDPVHGSDSNYAQSYQEKGTTTFTNPTTIPINQDGMWDFALVANHSIGNTDYCFKVVNNAGGDLSAYNVYPELTIPPASITQGTYRWYNTTPQGASTTFVKAYGTTNDDYANAVIQTNDGGYATVGYTGSDCFLAKYGKNGDLTWQTSIANGANCYGQSLVQLGDGSYIMGSSNTSTPANFISKYDASGNLVWDKAFQNGSQMYELSTLIATTDGGFASVGTLGVNSGTFIAKYDASGVTTWVKSLTSVCYWECSLAQTNDGSYLVTGLAYLSNYSFVAKLSSNGTLGWYKSLGGAYTYAEDIVTTSDGGFAITGYTGDYGSGSYDMFLAKYDASGTLSWNKTWGGSGVEYAYSLIQTSDGGYAVTGSTASFSDTTNGDMFLAKYDASGALSWNKTWGGSGADCYDGENGRSHACSVRQTSDGGYVVATDTKSYGTGSLDAVLIKYDPSGNVGGCSASMCQAPSALTTSTAFSTGTANPTISTVSVSSVSPTLTVDTVATNTTVVVPTVMPTGSPMAPLNTPLDLASFTPVNLRVAVRVDGSGIGAGSKNFQLQYAPRNGAATCSAAQTPSYQNITTSTPIAYYDDGRYNSGQKIDGNSNDPSDGSRTIVSQTYQETNDFTNSVSSVYAGQDAMWQFSLVIDNTTIRGRDFCLRIAYSGGTLLSADYVPDVAYAPMMDRLMGSGNWFSRSTGKRQSLVL